MCHVSQSSGKIKVASLKGLIQRMADTGQKVGRTAGKDDRGKTKLMRTEKTKEKRAFSAAFH